MSDTTSSRYADKEAFDRYEENDGLESVATRRFNFSPSETFDLWIELCWNSWVATELEKGHGRGQMGHKRKVPLGIVEQITSVGLPSDKSDEIPSIEYKLRKYGPFLISDHVGFVSFVPDTTMGQPSTLVIWKVKTTPSPMGKVLCFGGAGTRALLSGTLACLLKELDVAIKFKKRRE